MERKHLAVVQKKFLPIAQPCPRCGLPAEKTEMVPLPESSLHLGEPLRSGRMEDTLQYLSSGN